ncbi:MAG: ADP-ribosylation factor-like protein [Deltaproteobacteria bacterium]|nr:ADP-ribosylation factor-like protein [Deltaproteobacteria bacterium]
MVYFSPATKEITAKIVYYGPGMCGKTTNLQKVHELMRPQMKSELVSVATETDRTIYFDFLPVKLGKIAGFDFVVRSFTVPGQPYYGETRKMVLQGADGVVFVADSQRYMLDQNKDSLLDLKRMLKANSLDYATIPLVMQYNKRDLPDCLTVPDLEQALNDRKVPFFEASAFKGIGVVETLKAVTLTVFKHVRDGGLQNIGKPAGPARSQVQVPAAMAAAAQPAPVAPSTPTAASLPRPPSMSAPRPVMAPTAPVAPPSEALQSSMGALISNTTEGSAPMPSKDAIGMQEFQNMAVLHHRLTERVAQLEKELTRVSQEHQDLKRIVGRKLMGT